MWLQDVSAMPPILLKPASGDDGRMRVVIATFASSDKAEAFMRTVNDQLSLGPSAMSMATVAAYREPYDGHRIVAAWVDDEQEPEARQLAIRAGGTVHSPSGEPTPDQGR